MAEFSAVIITRSADEIERCLNSLRPFCSDIVVVDSTDSDAIKKVCQNGKARYFNMAWEGYGQNKNFGNSRTKNDWILSIDDDEELDPLLGSQITTALKSSTREAYYLPFLSNYCGKWIKHGRWFPEKHIRLFRKTLVEWNNAEVHEELVLTNKENTGELDAGYINHYTIKSIKQHIEKVNYYSDLAAEKMFRLGKKSAWYKIIVNPLWKFFSDYILRRGFLDGSAGLLIAVISSFDTFLKYAKLRHKYKGENSNK